MIIFNFRDFLLLLCFTFFSFFSMIKYAFILYLSHFELTSLHFLYVSCTAACHPGSRTIGMLQIFSSQTALHSHYVEHTLASKRVKVIRIVRYKILNHTQWTKMVSVGMKCIEFCNKFALEVNCIHEVRLAMAVSERTQPWP